MKITRRFTAHLPADDGGRRDVFAAIDWTRRTSRITNPDGSVVFEMTDAEVPASWSQLATDIMVSKYFRKAGVPQVGPDGRPRFHEDGAPITGPETSARQTVARLAGCWADWGKKHGYFDAPEDAQAFHDEIAWMLLHQMAAPNSPQWFNTGLHHAYGITGPAQGHYYVDPADETVKKATSAYERPQPHACQPYHATVSTPQGPIPIGEIVANGLTGLEVYDGTAEGRGTTRVVAVADNGSKPVYRIVLKNGAAVEATADHLVNADGEWLRVDQVKRGMRMMEVRDLPVEIGECATDAGGSCGSATRSSEARRHARTAGRGPAATVQLLELPRSRVLMQPVQRIEQVGILPVYDIQTESGQYLSNNVLVHNCFIQSVGDDLVNEGGIMDLWTREARLFKYGSGTGTNFTKVRGEDEPLSGGGKSSGLMSFLKIGDRAAGAIKSGGTTRRAAKMVCLDLDHPDIESFVNWKVREELKVAAMVEGMKHLSGDQKQVAEELRLKLNYDFNGEAYYTVSGQNSNNSVRIPNAFFEALENDGDWTLYRRTDGEVHRTVKARDLWENISRAAWRCADPGVQYDTTINQWHTCPGAGRINASNPCVTGDTRVLTPGGIWRRIDEMIHLPARVVTNLDEQEIHVVDGSFPTGEKPVFELVTESGYRLKLTADHKVWTKNRGWVEARHLTRDDECKLMNSPAAVERVGEPSDERLFHLVGFLLSDANGGGSVLDLSRCGLGGGDVEEYGRYVGDHWGRGARQSRDRRREANDGGVMVAEPETETLVRSDDRRMLGRLGAFIKTPLAGGRRLSGDAFTAGLAAQKHLLRGLFTADGIVTNETVGLRSPRLGLLQDVQLLLLGFGVRAVVTGGDGDAVLRVDPRCLKLFARHVGLLPGDKLDALSTVVHQSPESHDRCDNWDRIAGLHPVGVQQVFDLTEPHTSSFVANGITVHNCSEYMFLDDTACNLASLNVLRFFDSETKRFDLDAYRHAVRLWTVVLEISVLMASFPSERIAELSYKYRTLGLGYANLGAMLMQAGIAYDSDAGRAICGALTAVLTGDSYAASAEMAGEHGPFPGYGPERENMLRVIRNHRRAAYGEEGYEDLDIKPVSIDAGAFDGSTPLLGRDLLTAARDAWDKALDLGERHGYRNAQATVIAPTGTIGLLMDCDTTGVEPDFALVKFKKLAGGGYFKIANQSLRPALASLGYDHEQADEIMKYVLGTLTFAKAPHINRESLVNAGFTNEELDAIEQALPAAFELPFAFSPWSLSPQTLKRLGVTDAMKADPAFGLLRHLGFTKQQIDEANLHVCGRGTVEDAPHLKAEHYDVFDCANKCGKLGTRYIAAGGHIRMMAAAQPFISGAISKTINLPHEASVEEVKEAYRLSWQLGLKANALYRDGSKLSQPLNIKSDETDEEDEDDVEAAREEVATDVARAAHHADGLQSVGPESESNVEDVPHRVIEKIVERVVHRPLRRKLPDTRQALTHKFDIGGHEGYITVGLYEDGSPGEIFITMNKEGSTVGGLMDTIATLASLALQYGVKVEDLVRKFEHVRFEPSGMTRNRDIPMAKSIVDYLFRWLAMEFIPGYKAANSPQRAKPDHAGGLQPAGFKSSNGNGNGHSTMKPDAKPLDYTVSPTETAGATAVLTEPAPASSAVDKPARGRLAATVADPLSLSSTAAQGDAPACDVCGSITVRSGTCYKCLNCGNSMGCS